MSQVSRGHLSFLDPPLNYLVELVEAVAQFAVVEGLDGHDLGQARAEDSVGGAGAEQGRAPSLPGHPIAVSPRDPLDQAVEPEPAQVVRHLARGHVVGGLPQQGGPVVPQVAVGETPGQETEYQQRTEQRLDGRVGESQTTGSLPIDPDRIVDPMASVLPQGTTPADPL